MKFVGVTGDQEIKTDLTYSREVKILPLQTQSYDTYLGGHCWVFIENLNACWGRCG